MLNSRDDCSDSATLFHVGIITGSAAAELMPVALCLDDDTTNDYREYRKLNCGYSGPVGKIMVIIPCVIIIFTPATTTKHEERS